MLGRSPFRRAAGSCGGNQPAAAHRIDGLRAPLTQSTRAPEPQTARLIYFLSAGFFFSCFGFMPFLSFFCELLPLPMLLLLLVRVQEWLPVSHSTDSIGTIAVFVQF